MPGPAQIVIFGASGDLTARKLVPALLGNVATGALDPARLQVVGVSRTEKATEAWRDELETWCPPELKSAWAAFRGTLHYVAADVSKPAGMDALNTSLDELAEPLGGPAKVGRLFYLALAPELFGPVTGLMAARGMLQSAPFSSEAFRRVVIEKPFGVDLPTAQALNRELLQYLREDQTFRIDHYLGKETVQNILSLRFQNAIFEPLWNRNHVESVEISVLETVAMEGRRGAYYDGAGALRDMVQNHLMQILALVAMEPPGSLKAEAVRSEKVKVVGSLRRFTPKEVASHVVRGQYVAGPGRDRGYRQEPGVSPGSRTETYVAMRALVDNWRWSGVPFLLRTGKALHRASTEVILRFRTPPVDLLNGPQDPGLCVLRPNTLRLLVQPKEGVRLSFHVKEPGAGMVMRHAELGFDYADLGHAKTPPAYQRLLLDAIEGNATLFLRGDEVESAWAFADAIRAGWEEADPPVHRYPAGSGGPEVADALFQGCEGELELMHLLTRRTFAPLFWTQFLGAFNDNLLKQTLAMWVFNQQLSVFGIGHHDMVMLITAIFIAPYFLFSATAGQLTDKLDKSFMVRVTKNIEIVAMAVGALGFWFGQPEVVLVVLFAMGTQSTLFGPAKYGILPQHLPPEDLVEGNALVETATQLAILGGTITGGLCWQYRPEVAVAIVILAIIGRVVAQFVPSAPSSEPDLAVQWDPIRPTWALVTKARKNRVIWLSILGISWFWMFGAAVLPLLQVYTEEVIHGSDLLQTLFLTLFSVGVGVGSMWAGRLSHDKVELGIVPIGSLGMTVFTADLWWMGTPWPDLGHPIGPVAFLSTFNGIRISVDLVLLAVSGGIMTVPLYALIQQRADKTEKARVIAVNNIVNSFWMVIGALLLVALKSVGMTTSQMFLLLGVSMLLVTGYIYWVVREFALRFVTWILSNVMYRVAVVDGQKIPRTGPCLITPNHVSFIDWFVLLGALHEPPRVVMDRDIHKWPVLGFLFRQANTIPITSAKVDPKCLEQAMDDISKALREGWSVVIFPEGRLTGTGDVGEFRAGIERILERDPVPVVPVAINGLWGSFFSRKDGAAMTKPFRRGSFNRVWLTFGDLIPAGEANAKRAEDAVRALWSRMPDQP